MPFKERDVRKTIAEVEATSWRLRKCIRAKELTATHRLERMQHLRMLKEEKAWKRAASFDEIDIIAEMDEQRSCAGFDLDLYSKLLNPSWPLSSEEIERLRLEVLLWQPAPSPQDDISPRRSPKVGTGSDEPELPRTGKESMDI